MIFDLDFSGSRHFVAFGTAPLHHQFCKSPSFSASSNRSKSNISTVLYNRAYQYQDLFRQLHTRCLLHRLLDAVLGLCSIARYQTYLAGSFLSNTTQNSLMATGHSVSHRRSTDGLIQGRYYMWTETLPDHQQVFKLDTARQFSKQHHMSPKNSK